jgi:hypothetical protein
VRGDLVAALGDGADQARLVTRHHAQGEEGPVRAALVEQIEQPERLGHNAAGEMPEPVVIEGRTEPHAVIVLLDVHGEDVGRAGVSHARLP